ncbi:response regulator transcription factor [Chryseobacterium sp. M5A1_1a]
MTNIQNSFWDRNDLFDKNSEIETPKNYLEELRGLARMTFGGVYIVDLIHEKIEILSGNSVFFSGLKCSEVERLGYNYYRKYTRNNGLKILRKVHTIGFKFFECLSSEEKRTHSITFDFHMADPNDAHVLLNHKMTPVKICENGDIAKLICVVSFSQNRTAGNICVSRNESKTYWRFNLSTDKWFEESRIKLKKREIEIMRLYLQGLTIEKIAEQLYLSASTIKFHRTRLFDKLGVNNITEAISFVKKNNLL